jgi:hypothetical protein
MTNQERLDLVESAPIDSGLKEAVIYLLRGNEESTRPPSELRIKNTERGNTAEHVQKGDVWIRFTSPKDLKVLAWTGEGDPEDLTTWHDIGGFEMERID